MMPNLKCSRCGEEKPCSEFFLRKDPASRRGYSSHCKECRRAYERTIKRKPRMVPDKRIKNQGLVINARIGVPAGHKRCSRCKLIKPSDLHCFPKRRDGQASSWCRECYRAYARKRMAEKRRDPSARDIIAAAKKRHAQSPKGKAAKRESSRIHNNIRRQRTLHLPWNWSIDAWSHCKEYWQYKCAYCLTQTNDLEQDHFIPLSCDSCPGTVPSNIVPACKPCNRSKGARTGEEWCLQEQLERIDAYFMSLESIGALAANTPRPWPLDNLRGAA